MNIKIFVIWILVSSFSFISYSQNLTGKVIHENGLGIKEALISLVNTSQSDVSKDDGTWSISVTSSIEPIVRKHVLPAPFLRGNILYFAVADMDVKVTVSLFALNGKKQYHVVRQNLTTGFYSLNPVKHYLPPNMYVLQVKIGETITHFKLLVTDIVNNNTDSRLSNNSSINATVSTAHTPGALEKRMVIIDTIKVSKAGFSTAAVPISSYNSAPFTITLKELKPDYYRNPPDPCYNQFYVDSCIPGDPNSACGGNCRVANSCSPPEDQSKADLPKTFICPRFMLFSSEMIQAAKDDAILYGWGDGENPPFNYGVVGHDPDVGGVDDVQSSCCQCYQIIYVKPEPSSPQPPDLPYPKSLIVQSFNTAASGPKGFDVFMGAGGYGAFNSCYNDPEFHNTTTFDEFIYDEYPYQNPGSGGISFLRYPECIKGWPPTIDGVLSAACQEKIKKMCNQALVKASEQVTEDTRRSCIQCNKLESLYHQNWDVMVKRVRCPDNLTRVTGCRLKEEKLPLPHPDVQNPAEARTNGTFREGYHTTTMQDCCKPTCAWANWTEGYNLPIDGEWNSFYSCDKNGVPFTR